VLSKLLSTEKSLKGYLAWIPVVMGPTILWMLKYLLPLILTYCMFLLVYKVVPNKMVHFKPALKAALFASLLWELAKHLFAWYVTNIATYSIFYGSLSALVVFVLWVYYFSMILVVGGNYFIYLKKIEKAEKNRKWTIELIYTCSKLIQIIHEEQNGRCTSIDTHCKLCLSTSRDWQHFLIATIDEHYLRKYDRLPANGIVCSVINH
jgi:uncharacterized BrkB/YihY/UPF0761 family membrane protein